jgi:hypothetical protein
MARNRAAALAQIRSMLDMAAAANTEGSPTTQEEAAVAMAGAARLMAKWQIEDGEIGNAAEGRARTTMGRMTYSVDNMDNCGAQRRSAVFQIIRILGAEGMYTPVKNRTGSGVYGFTIEIFGVESTIAFLEVLLPSFVLQLTGHLERDAKTYRTGLREQDWYTPSEINKEISGYRRAYIAGFGEIVAVKIASFRSETIDESKGTGTAELVLKSDYDRAVAARDEKHPKLRANKARQNTGNRQGRADGRTAGSQALVGQTEVRKETNARGALN